MQWFSLLPDNLSVVESWLKTVFLFLAVITIGPWAVLIVYDILLYIYRSICFEIPFIGGRARGKERPRAPSLTERADGERRDFGILPMPVEEGTPEVRRRHVAVREGEHGPVAE